MPRPFELIDTVMTAEGPLELRKRGEGDFMILSGGQVLMTSVIQNSEIELGKVACAKVCNRTPLRVLIGGLGLGFTLRAALDALPARAEVVVAELNAVVVQWCRGPLAQLTAHSLADPRVRVVVGDVTAVIRDGTAQGQARFDAIIWDLYRGPAGNESGPADPLYGRASIERTHRALNAGGVYAVWGETPDPSFAARLERCGFRVEQTRSSGKGPKHALFIATK